MHGHYSLSHISRRRGKSAADHLAYVTRTGAYAERGDLAWVDSGHFPAWADSAAAYMEVADALARTNARLLTHSNVALPQQLTLFQQQALVRDIVQVTIPQQPYVAVIHHPQDAQGQVHNPHAHISWSGKTLDGQARTAAEWWQAAPTGAPVNRALTHRAMLVALRETVTDLTNVHLHEAGQSPSYYLGRLQALGSDREPDTHQWKRPATATPTPKDERSWAIATFLQRARQLGLTVGMTLAEKVRCVARDFQARLAQWTQRQPTQARQQEQSLAPAPQRSPAWRRAIQASPRPQTRTPQTQDRTPAPTRSQPWAPQRDQQRPRERERGMGRGMEW